MSKRIVIIGGVSGATVAAQIRRKDREADITLFDKGEEIAFSNCGMPYFLGDIVDEREKLLVSSESFSEKHHVDVRLNTKVSRINRKNKTYQFKNESGTFTENYDKLILAPGASPITPNIKGMQWENVFVLRTIPDMDEMQAYIDRQQPKSVAIIGAGFIGLEMAENLSGIGLECNIVDRSSQVMKLVDVDMATMIQEHMEEKGVRFFLKDGLESFSDGGTTLHLNSGASIHADMTILAVGIQPNTSLAKDASIELGMKETIRVNEYMQTNDPDIYALGDAVQIKDFHNDKPRHVALAGPAHRQAYIIAMHLAGEAVPYTGTIGASIFKVFDLTVAVSGNTEKVLQEYGYQYKSTILNGFEHAGYYPGSQKLTLKILFDAKTGIIYSAQVIGFGGVDKRHAVLATAMKGNMTVYDLAGLELAYAPPYSSPKDPINLLGYKAIAQMERL
ncbi:MAG TPA: CoA-disulfide reductase [Bacillota bacterium]|nr:CoA-disulfide reductase [Bacillota bacterium]